MTEQEKREKEVRKISEIIKQHYTPICTACFEEAKECFVCAADAVRDYMISKMEEVQKETAREIIYGIVNLTHIIELDEEVEEHIYSHLFDECKKYGLNEQEFIDRII